MKTKEEIKKKGIYDYKIGEVNNEDMINGIMKAPNKLVKIGYTFQDINKTQMEVAVKHKDFIEDEEYDKDEEEELKGAKK